MEVINVSSFPLLAHYGDHYKRISRKEAEVADFDARFKSIGRFVVGQAIRFCACVLSPEGRVAYDPEDVFLELWTELRIRNDRYVSDRGEYLTFAQRVVSNKLSEMLECTHCVQLPANAAEKFNELIEMAREKPLNTRQQHRLMALISANVDHAPMKEGQFMADTSCMPEEEAIRKERRKLSEDVISRLLPKLSLIESLSMRYGFGLWQCNGRTISFHLAECVHGFESGTLQKAFVNAKRKMRRICRSLKLDSSWL